MEWVLLSGGGMLGLKCKIENIVGMLKCIAAWKVGIEL